MKKLIYIIPLIALMACTDAKCSKVTGYGNQFKIDLINCDGTISKSWTSTGKVQSEANSDGYYFTDKATGKLIEVTGRLVISEI